MPGTHASPHRGEGDHQWISADTLTGIVVVACLITLQWMTWWTFLVAMALLTTLGVRFYRASIVASTSGGRPRGGYCRSVSGVQPRLPLVHASKAHVPSHGRRLPAQQCRSANGVRPAPRVER